MNVRSLLAISIPLYALSCSQEPDAIEAGTTGAAVEAVSPEAPPPAKEAQNPAEPVKYDSPEAVFAAAKAAAEAKDYAALVKTIEPKSRRDMAVGLIVVLGFVTFGDPSLKPEVEALVAKHGLPDEKGMKKIKGSNRVKMKKLGDMIENPSALVVDAMQLFEKAVENQKAKGKKKGRVSNPGNGIAFGELVDLKVNGDKAKAKMKPEKGKAKKIDFVKVEDSWYLVAELK